MYIKHLKINDFMSIRSLEVYLDKQFNILTEKLYSKIVLYTENL